VNGRSRPEAASHLRALDVSRRLQPRFGDDPRVLDDDELLLLARSMLAVDRAVDRYRGRPWPA
jgi:hypothetical protein